MLELLHNDLVGSFNKRFIEIVSTQAVPTIDMQSVFKQAKASEIKSGLLEFYVSVFIHQLTGRILKLSCTVRVKVRRRHW